MQPREAKILETQEPKRLESRKPKRQLETGGVNNPHTKFNTLKTTKFSQGHDGIAVNLYN